MVSAILDRCWRYWSWSPCSWRSLTGKQCHALHVLLGCSTLYMRIYKWKASRTWDLTSLHLSIHSGPPGQDYENLSIQHVPNQHSRHYNRRFPRAHLDHVLRESMGSHKARQEGRHGRQMDGGSTSSTSQANPVLFHADNLMIDTLHNLHYNDPHRNSLWLRETHLRPLT